MMYEHRNFQGIVEGQTCKAVLLRRGGAMETVIEFRYPPPPRYYEPWRPPLALSPTPASGPLRHVREFELDQRLRSPDHQWWFVYNNGATRSPFNAYVYREIGNE